MTKDTHNENRHNQAGHAHENRAAAHAEEQIEFELRCGLPVVAKWRHLSAGDAVAEALSPERLAGVRLRAPHLPDLAITGGAGYYKENAVTEEAYTAIQAAAQHAYDIFIYTQIHADQVRETYKQVKEEYAEGIPVDEWKPGFFRALHQAFSELDISECPLTIDDLDTLFECLRDCPVNTFIKTDRRHYRKQAGSVHYNTQNFPGTGVTAVYIKHHPEPYPFCGEQRKWSPFKKDGRVPDLPKEDLEALEDALVEHHNRRLAWFNQQRHIGEVTQKKDNVLEVTTIYEGSFTVEGAEAFEPGVSSYWSREDGHWFSYKVAHGPDKIKEVRRRAEGITGSPEYEASRRIFEAELEEAWRIQQQTSLENQEGKENS